MNGNQSKGVPLAPHFHPWEKVPKRTSVGLCSGLMDRIPPSTTQSILGSGAAQPEARDA